MPVLAAPDSPDTPILAASAFDPVVGDADALAQRLNALKRDGYKVFICAEGTRQRGPDRADPRRRGRRRRPHQRRPRLGRGAARARHPHRGRAARPRRGAADATLALVAEADLTGRRRVHRRARGARKGLDHYEGLTVGDYVVHRVHGVGRYHGMETKEMFGVTRDRLVVEFKGGDRVYVDSEDIGLIRKYTGGEEPKLSKMGGADWDKARAKVRKAVRDIAGELVVLYRRRLATVGHVFGPDTPFQHQIEEAFPYEETPDQAKAIIETKADMERAVPMDRLVCGDVGYGKTEVALRAAAKAVFDGKQVAILVPTTLLASQHGQTFRERFANYPVRVEVLSRFLTDEGTDRRREGRARRHRRHRHRHAPAARRRHRVQGRRPARRRRGAALRRAAQGADQGVARERRRAHAHRHAHSRARWRCRSPASAISRS